MLADLPEEAPLEPEMPIIDPHHHVWEMDRPMFGWPAYTLDQLGRDKAASGHNVLATVALDSREPYLETGPEEMRSIGETRYVEAKASAADQAGGFMAGLGAGIVTHVDCSLGAAIEPVLAAHLEASPRFRGTREVVPYHPGVLMYGQPGAPEQLRSTAFRDALKCHARLGLTFDTYLLYSQLSDVAYLARAVPEATIILDHVGSPNSVPGIAEDEAEKVWRTGLREVATCPNVLVKLGGLFMNHQGPSPVRSEQAAEVMRHHIFTAIDLFGPDRCMFESNFPVDGAHLTYGAVWNAFKSLTVGFSADERAAMFHDTAARTYRLKTA